MPRATVTSLDRNLAVDAARATGTTFGRTLVLALISVTVVGCGTVREQLASRFGREPRIEAEEPVLGSPVDAAPRPVPITEAPLRTVEIQQAAATTTVTERLHGDPSAFDPVRPRIDGSVRIMAQQPTTDEVPELEDPIDEEAINEAIDDESTEDPNAPIDPTDPLLRPRRHPPRHPPLGPPRHPPLGPRRSVFEDGPALGDSADRRVLIPARPEGEEVPQVEIESQGDHISLVARDAPIGTVVAVIAQQQGLNVIASEDIPTHVSVTLQDVRLDDALGTLLTVAGYTWTRQGNIIVISRISTENKLAPYLQGRTVHVFRLNFVAAVDVEKVVSGLLSPLGSVQTIESASRDQRRTQESLVVEDLPAYVVRVADYIAQVDQPPRQVLVEAHVLQVDLDDSCRHGVNFEHIGALAGTNISLRTAGFSNPDGSPAFFLGLSNNELNSLVEALKTTEDAKTLASPKVLVVNGQEARIQIGASLGYFVTTTTETSTLQNVDFLDLGVVLHVTPIIGDDGNILMTVRPEVSSGQINAVTGLPEEDTTEVETTVMLGDGQAMIIGGLIKEESIDNQSKLPILGDMWLIGRAFQRRAVTRKRQEVIVALVPRVVPICGPAACRELEQVDRATSPLLTPDLQRAHRPWEPELPDAMNNPRRPSLRRMRQAPKNVTQPYPNPPTYYFPTP